MSHSLMCCVKSIFIAAVAVRLATSTVPSNTEDGKGVLFSTENKGLPWPITSWRDPGVLLQHGSHCMSMVRKLAYKKSWNDVEKFHNEHCKALLNKVLDFYAANPDFSVHNAVCKALVPSKTRGLDYNLDYSNVRQKPVAIPQLLHHTTEQPMRGVDYDYKTGGPTPKDVFNLISSQVSDRDQTNLFETLSGQNLGDILMKEWKKENMTVAEEAFIKGWQSDDVISLAAVGLFCSEGRIAVPVSDLRGLIS